MEPRREAPRLVVGSEVRGYDSPKSIVSEVKKVKVKPKRSFYFDETFICYRGCLNLNCYMGKKVHENFLMGLKVW